MKKFLVLGLGMFAVFATFAMVSVANAQFVVGDRVQATSVLSVRATPSATGTLLGVQATGTQGTVVGGPVYNGYTWWNVDYDIAPDGWSAGDWLMKVGGNEGYGEKCDYDGNGFLDSLDLGSLIDYLFNGGLISGGTTGDVNADGQPDALDLSAFIDHLFVGQPVPVGCQVVQTNQPPVIQSFSGPSIMGEDTYGTWNAQAYDPEGGRLNYTFNWGDGNPASTTIISNATSGYPVTAWHYYANPGTYPIMLTVQDQSLAADYASVSVTVLPTSTLAMTGLNWPTALQVGEVGTWSVFATGSPSSNMLNYEFYWGDGTGVSTTAWGGFWLNQTHSYSQPGNYSLARVRVSDDLGGSDQEYTPVTVTTNGTSTQNQPPTMNSFTGPSSLNVGQVGTWYANATDPEGGFLNYYFDLGNASRTASGASGQTVSVTNSYSQTGTYSNSVYALDGANNWSNNLWRSVSVGSAGTSSAPILPTTQPIYYMDPYPIQTNTTKLPVAASTIESLQRQINALYQQLQILRAQL